MEPLKGHDTHSTLSEVKKTKLLFFCFFDFLWTSLGCRKIKKFSFFIIKNCDVNKHLICKFFHKKCSDSYRHNLEEMSAQKLFPM